MSNFMENGPSNHNGETEQVWERPWTLEEMQKSSTNWSLAADSGLFLFLQDFSQRMLSKTHEIEKQLDGLIQDTKATDSRLHTVFNDFLMLSNTQFIENRVYDEEVEDPAPKPETMEKHPEQEKTREQKEAELIPKVQEAVNYGLKVLESAFEQLDIKAGNSDSEDEETLEKVEPILEAKDLYVDRPLPYLIGSQAFMDQEDVGLGDLSSDEMSIGSGRDSVIESDVEEGDEQSDEYSDQDEEVHGNFKKKPSVASYDDADEENEDEDSDIFGGSDKDEDELKKDTGLPSFADELAARIKGETPNKPEADRTSLSSGPSITQKKSKTKKESKPQVEDDQDEMFKPPKMEDEEYSPFGGKGGLFSGGKGLFDDEDEGDLFSDAPKTEPLEKEKTVIQATEPPKTKKIPTGAVSIFRENKLLRSPNDSDSLESKGSESPVKPKVQAAPKRASVGGGLFDDDDDDDDFFSGKAPNKSTPGQEKQMPKKTVDLFGEADEEDDDDDDEDMNTDDIIPAPKTSTSTEKNALTDHGPQMTSTGVFQDEELLFSHTQQRDNDPDVDLFATSPKPSAPSQSSGKPAVPTLFGDDEDDDLFSSAKPKAPPKVPEKPSKSETNEMDKSTLTSSKASLVVNPASLLPGAVPRIPGAVSVIPGLAPASLPAAAKPLQANDKITDHQPCSEGGVGFDSPAQVSTLQNANKGRAKGAVRRRPQTRAARHLAAQESEEADGESTSTQADEAVMAASLPTFNPVSVRPSALTIPVSTPAPAKSPDEAVRPKRFLDPGDHVFDSDDLFATKPVPSSKHKVKTPEEGHKKASKTEAVIASKKDQTSSIFDSHEDDLFATVKQKNVQKGKQMSFLEDDDDDDIFGAGKSKSTDSKNSKAEASSAKPGIFQDELKEPPKAQKKPNEVSLDASLFDDDVDIFADLTGTTKPKEKKAKKKLETKSIFDDDMDDIFSTGATKPTVKPSSKSKKSQPAQDPVSAVETGSSIFDDPLNAFEGN
uniref:WASH complex subunit 2C n=1 Tax=Cyprinus carpio carpio TaxID=630221 RepID=A0A8C1AQS0_CYPCA